MQGWGERWWGAAGIVFAVLFLVAFALVGNSGDTGEEIRAYFADHETRAIVAFFLFSLAALAYVVFVAALRVVLAAAEEAPQALTALGFGAGLVTAALIVAGAAPLGALADRAGEGDAASTDVFAVVSSLVYPVLTTGIAFSSLLALATGLIALRTRVLPRWVAWASIAAAPLILVAVLFLPIFVFLGWVLAVSVALLLRRAPAVRAPLD